MKLQPFDNETQSMSLGDLTIENRLDQLEIYGSLSITLDQAGLALALQLKQLMDDTEFLLSYAPEYRNFRVEIMALCVLQAKCKGKVIIVCYVCVMCYV